MPHKDAHTNAANKRTRRLWRVGALLLPRVTCAVICLSPLLHVAATTEAKVTLRRDALAARPDGQSDVDALVTGVTIERKIKGGETHHYQVRFEADQYARIVIKRLDVNLLVNASGPGRHDAAIYESPAGPQSPLVVSLVAEAPGLHDIKVRPVERWAAEGRYEIRLEDVRAAGPDDRKRAAAGRKVAEARRLQLLDTEESRRAAIAAYKEGLALWEEIGDGVEQANTLHFIAQTYRASGGGYFDKAVESYEHALTLRPEEDAQARAYTYLALADLYRDLKNPATSLPHYQKALELFEAGNNARGRAAALYGRGLAKALQREMPAALKDYEAALLIYGSPESRDRHEEARTLQAMGGAYEVQGAPDRALEFFNRALEGWQETGDPARAGNTYNSIAKLADDRGDWQEALDNYDKALAYYEQGEAAAEHGKAAIRNTRAVTLYNLGFTYAALGDYQKAVDLLKQSLPLRGDSRRGQGITHMAMGYFHALAGEPRAALESCDRALPLQKEAGDPRESHTLTVMGIARAAMGEHREALVLYNRALEIQQNTTRRDPQAEAITQVRRGDSLAALGDVEQALAAYGRSRQLYRESKDRNGESVALFGMARVESSRNNLTAALKLVEDALEAAEPLRANVTSQQLRVSYFAAKVNYYELYIDLSMRLRAGGGEAERTAAAFEASERARARSLLDMLSQARVEAGRRADPELAALAEKHLRLQREIQAKKALSEPAPSRKDASEDAGLKSEIAKLYAEREGVEAQLRSRYPRYASLMYPQPLTAAGVQSLLDEETLLLEFALGEERSYAWALTATKLQGYTLPPRSELEETARRLSELLRAGQPLPNDSAAERAKRMARAEAEYWPLAAQFSRTLFGPVASLLKKRRLLIIADGQLNYLPLGALPLPSTGDAAAGASIQAALSNVPLVTDHEVVSLPSASVLSVLRQTVRREQATKSVAVFADPIFDKDDPRLRLATRAKSAGSEQSESVALASRELDSGGGDTPKLQRLLASGREARDILSFAPSGSSMEATGFKASRESLLGARLSQYRVVHFATHGILNEQNPELSGVVLSLYDEQGRFHKDGFVRLGDIFGLHLPVDLVVLSACRTALGKEVRGEGLIGLTRGFMYAGAPRVIASMWNVDDDATAELMKRFYQKMLKEGMTPASALMAAQASMAAQKRWSNPYYWAGFVLLGEPK